MDYPVSRDDHERSGIGRVLHVARASAEASIVAVGFGLAILLIGLPVIGWLVGGRLGHRRDHANGVNGARHGGRDVMETRRFGRDGL